MKKNKIAIFLVVFFILIAAGFSFWAYPVIKKSRENQLGYFGGPDHKVRPFKFVNQDGDTVTQDVMKGKFVVVEYFYTTCKSICPIMNGNMVKVYDAFKNSDDVLILSHTVDPMRDSVAAMKAYSRQFDADSRHWMFLTGDKQQLYNQARYSYLITAVDTPSQVNINDDFIHEKYFVLVDKQGRLRAHEGSDGRLSLYDGTDPKSVQQLIDDIHALQAQPNE